MIANKEKSIDIKSIRKLEKCTGETPNKNDKITDIELCAKTISEDLFSRTNQNMAMIVYITKIKPNPKTLLIKNRFDIY